MSYLTIFGELTNQALLIAIKLIDLSKQNR